MMNIQTINEICAEFRGGDLSIPSTITLTAHVDKANLDRLEAEAKQIANDIYLRKGALRTKASDACEKTAIAWLDTIPEIAIDSGYVAFKDKFIAYLGKAATHLYQDITDRSARDNEIPLSTAQKFIELQIWFYSLNQVIRNSTASNKAINELAEVITILSATFGTNQVSELLFNLATAARDQGFPQEFRDIVHNQLVQACECEIFNAQRPAYNSLTFYRDVLYSRWTEMSLEQQLATGHKLEDFSRREMELIHRGYKFPHIGYAGTPNPKVAAVDAPARNRRPVPRSKLKLE